MTYRVFFLFLPAIYDEIMGWLPAHVYNVAKALSQVSYINVKYALRVYCIGLGLLWQCEYCPKKKSINIGIRETKTPNHKILPTPMRHIWLLIKRDVTNSAI